MCLLEYYNMNIEALKLKWLSFMEEIGLKHVAEILWQANIYFPQELAALMKHEIKKICNCPILIMKHSVLCLKALFIGMSEDPFQAAKCILMPNSQQEPNEPDSSRASTSEMEHTKSDSSCTSTLEIGHSEPDSSCASTSEIERIEHDSGFQSDNSFVNPDNEGNGKDSRLNISGGTFIQSSVGNRRTATYNNVDTRVCTSTPCKRPKTDNSVDSMELKDPLDQCSGMVFNNLDKREEVYELRDGADRLALILNIEKFKDGVEAPNRIGSDVDCREMKTIFEQLKFKVALHHDKTAAEIEELMSVFTRTGNENTDITAVYIGSHGQRDEEGNDSFMGSDGEMVSFTRIREKFYSDNCPDLKGKPKLFFLQFCRTDATTVPASEEIREVFLHSDAGREDATLSTNADRKLDIFCAFATTQDSSAYRNTVDGSWFVQSLKRVVNECSHTDDLQSMLTKVNSDVSSQSSIDASTNMPAFQTSEVVSSLRKKVFFHRHQS